jgi:class 3 adenylate cyclase
VGQAVVGNIGTVQQMNYTSIGDTVNLAKRLQESAEGGQIILSQAAYKAVQDAVEVEDLGSLTVKGRTASVYTYNLVGMKGVRTLGVRRSREQGTAEVLASDASHSGFKE